MIERTTEQRHIEGHRAGLWYTIEIAPRRMGLFHAWAQHLGLTDADLAARIFTEGTLHLAQQEVGFSVTGTADVPPTDVVETLLRFLEGHLATPPEGDGTRYAPDHD